MDTHGGHHPAYNPWDPPPPPQQPPSDHHWGGGGPPFYGGPPPPFPPAGAAHPKPHLSRKRKLDRPDINGNHAKLYVGPVPRYVSQEEVYHVFEEFGNVVEVVLLTDKKTGQQQEFCFVKYSSVAEAEGAISALHNQYTFPGTMVPLKLKYADGERKRLGLDHAVPHNSSLSRPVPHPVSLVQLESTSSGPETVHKVYVNGLNREASREEVLEIFSSYGVVDDIYIMRDDSKRSRGCCFVGFSQRCMAMAAINGLNGTYIMRGCDKPLIVRFADPKKPKNGDFRQTSHSVDVRRNNVSDAVQLGPPMCTKLSSAIEQTDVNCSVANQSRHPPHEMQQMLTERPFSPLRMSQVSLQESQTSQLLKAPIDAELNASLLSSEHGSWTSSEIDYSEAFEDCDWSEHICPDGNKYYFNRVTSESSWEKPEEFAVCERRILRQKTQDRSCKELPHISDLEAPPNEEEQIEAAPYERKSREFHKPQSTSSCAVEHSHEMVTDEPSSVGGAAVVQ